MANKWIYCSKSPFLLFSNEMFYELRVAIGILIEPKKSTLYATDSQKTGKGCVSH